jgi:ATP-dependent Clp protease ATP-binding subunit ClpA
MLLATTPEEEERNPERREGPSLHGAPDPELLKYVAERLRELRASNQELARRLDQLEARIEKKLVSHDEAIAAILSAIRELMNPPATKRRGIGFTADIGDPK